MQKLSVVILNWNGAEMLRRFLPSVIENSQMEGVEVVVADNGGNDDSLALMRRDFPDIRVIQLDQNYGFAEGYNRALRQIEAEYYLLLNNDVEIRQKDWLQPMLEYMDEHTDVAACQPKIRWLVEPQRFEYSGASGGYLDCYGFPFCRGRILSTLEQDMGQYDSVADVHWTTGCSLLIRSKDYWAAGGLTAVSLPTWKKSTSAGDFVSWGGGWSAFRKAPSITLAPPPLLQAVHARLTSTSATTCSCSTRTCPSRI